MAQHYKFPESTEQFKTKALYTIRKAILNLSLQQTEDFTCFYASILLNMKVVITDQIWIAGISNDTLYMNPRFVLGASKEELFNAKKQLEEAFNNNELDKKQYRLEKRALECVYETKTDKDLAFALFHEANHLVEETYIRGQALNLKSKADLDLWNIASDFVINGGIAKTMYKSISECKKQVPIARFGCMDDKYNGMTTEQVYLELKKKQKEQQKSSGSGGDSDEEVYIQFDEHMFDEMTEEEKQLLKDVIESAGRQAGKGKCPDSVWKEISKLEEAKINYKELIPALCSSQVVTDITYEQIDPMSIYMTDYCVTNNFIQPYQSIVLPTLKTESAVDIEAACDASGSMSMQERVAFLSEMKGMLSMFPSWTFRTHCFTDGIVEKSFQEFDSAQDDADNVVREINLGYSGGTNVQETLDYFSERAKMNSNKFFIVFTDGYLGSFKVPDNIKQRLIWIITTDVEFKADGLAVCYYKS